MHRQPGPARRTTGLSEIWQDVRWTPILVGLLGYIFAIITYRLPIGEASMALALLGLCLHSERFRVPAPLVWFALFILWCAFGAVQTEAPDVVGERLTSLAKVWLISLVVVNTLRNRSILRFFLVYYVLLYATHPARGAIFNYIQGYHPFGRALWNHAFGNPNDLAALTFLPIAMAAALTSDRNRWARFGAFLSLVVLPAVVLMTQSRAAFLGMVIFVVLGWMGQQRRGRGLLCIAVCALLAALIAPGGVWDRMGTLQDKGVEADSSSRQRYLIWKVANEIVRENSFVGVGAGAYAHAHLEATRGDPRFDHAEGGRDTHSTYLNVLAETGYPGLVLFLIMLLAVIAQTIRARARALSMGDTELAQQIWYLLAGLVGFLTAGIFGSYSHLSFLYIHIAVLASMSMIAQERTTGAGIWGAAATSRGPRLARA